MRYTRTALTIATTLLDLTTLGGTTAHANNEKDKGENGKSNICFIHVEGNHNHNACGDIKYGDNATTGQGHSVTRGQGSQGNECESNQTTIILRNSGSGTLTLDAQFLKGSGVDGMAGTYYLASDAFPATIAPGQQGRGTTCGNVWTDIAPDFWSN
ncbi:hypothetical protein [Streptomyces sp. NPDC086023]|uniref:hypothetical protein n=1 Tax=Streptomyces sp. NPDC086023 TaxID=3365746 RepID=UPI0037D567D2